jgi:hypothetical protein
VFPNITDLATWKKKFKVEDDVKIFICTGGYPDIKKALKRDENIMYIELLRNNKK